MGQTATESELETRVNRGWGRRWTVAVAVAVAVVAVPALAMAVGRSSPPQSVSTGRPSVRADVAASPLGTQPAAHPSTTTTGGAVSVPTGPARLSSPGSVPSKITLVTRPVPGPLRTLPPFTLPPLIVPPPGPRVTMFPVPTDASQPFGIVSGPDGNLWFTEGNRDVVGRITPRGVITEYHTPTAVSQPGAITVGADGNLWLTEMSGNNIARLTTAGVFTEFPIPTLYSEPRDIAAGPDGALWFTEMNVGKVSRVTLDGHITEFPAGTGTPVQIVSGGDGYLWFTDGTSSIGRISPNGSLSPVVAVAHISMVLQLAADHLGNLWYAGIDQSNPDRALIGRRDTAGRVTEFAVPGAGVQFAGITEGPDGAIWFTESTVNAVGRLAGDGTITTDSVPSPVSIVGGADGNLWITSGTNGNAVARLRIR